MGLFGFNVEKKLAKADENLEKGFYYDARIAYEEILSREGIPDPVRAKVKEGWKKARLALIASQIEEAKGLLAAGVEEEAAVSCRAAIELADQDLDASEAKRILGQIEGPPEAEHAELLRRLAETSEAEATPKREVDDADPENLAGGGSEEEVFEVYMNAVPEAIADRYRALGPGFREAFVRLQEGRASEAIVLLDSASDSIREDPLLNLERAQALLLLDRNEEALQAIDGMDLPKEAEARRSHMRVILLDRLGRREEAEEEARKLWTSDPGNQDATVLYGEVLISGGKHQEALTLLKPLLQEGRPQPEIDNLVALAYRGVGKVDEAKLLLERDVERYFQGGYASGDMQRFPIWAGRLLLEIYVGVGEDPGRINALRNHLIRHDPGNAERYLAAGQPSQNKESEDVRGE